MDTFTGFFETQTQLDESIDNPANATDADGALRRARELMDGEFAAMRELFRILHGPVFDVGADMNVRRVYTDHLCFAGYAAPELVGKNLAGIITEGCLARLRAALNNPSDGPIEIECEVKGKDETIYYYVINVLPLRDRDLNAGCRLSCADVTDLKKIKAEADDANRMKNEFLSRMSHEMRTPMNAILGMTGIAKKAADLGKKDFCLDKIETAGRHLMGVINDILDMSKIESHKFVLSNVEFNINEMIEGITDALRPRLDEKKHSFMTAVCGEMPASVVGDAYRLSQVTTHLLMNAVKFTPENGAISLTVSAEDAGNDNCLLTIKVADNGIGVAADMHEKIFKPFEQGDGGAARTYGGIGLGLVLAKHIVEMMGGRIRLDSEPGKGAVFIFTVNVKKGKTAGKARPGASGANARQTRAGDGPAAVDKTGDKNTACGTGAYGKDDNEMDGKGYAGVIDAQDGMRRLANNKKLYIKLLTNFKGRQMADEVINGIKEGDHARVSAAAHAIKGVASNLGFTKLTEASKYIEEQAKMQIITDGAETMIDQAAEECIAAIAAFLAEEGAV